MAAERRERRRDESRSSTVRSFTIVGEALGDGGSGWHRVRRRAGRV
jgi:hypothetical protein